MSERSFSWVSSDYSPAAAEWPKAKKVDPDAKYEPSTLAWPPPEGPWIWGAHTVATSASGSVFIDGVAQYDRNPMPRLRLFRWLPG